MAYVMLLNPPEIEKETIGTKKIKKIDPIKKIDLDNKKEIVSIFGKEGIPKPKDITEDMARKMPNSKIIWLLGLHDKGKIELADEIYSIMYKKYEDEKNRIREQKKKISNINEKLVKNFGGNSMNLQELAMLENPISDKYRQRRNVQRLNKQTGLKEPISQLSPIEGFFVKKAAYQIAAQKLKDAGIGLGRSDRDRRNIFLKENQSEIIQRAKEVAEKMLGHKDINDDMFLKYDQPKSKTYSKRTDKVNDFINKMKEKGYNASIEDFMTQKGKVSKNKKNVKISQAPNISRAVINNFSKSADYDNVSAILSDLTGYTPSSRGGKGRGNSLNTILKVAKRNAGKGKDLDQNTVNKLTTILSGLPARQDSRAVLAKVLKSMGIKGLPTSLSNRSKYLQAKEATNAALWNKIAGKMENVKSRQGNEKFLALVGKKINEIKKLSAEEKETQANEIINAYKEGGTNAVKNIVKNFKNIFLTKEDLNLALREAINTVGGKYSDDYQLNPPMDYVNVGDYMEEINPPDDSYAKNQQSRKQRFQEAFKRASQRATEKLQQSYNKSKSYIKKNPVEFTEVAGYDGCSGCGELENPPVEFTDVGDYVTELANPPATFSGWDKILYFLQNKKKAMAVALPIAATVALHKDWALLDGMIASWLVPSTTVFKNKEELTKSYKKFYLFESLYKLGASVLASAGLAYGGKLLSETAKDSELKGKETVDPKLAIMVGSISGLISATAIWNEGRKVDVEKETPIKIWESFSKKLISVGLEAKSLNTTHVSVMAMANNTVTPVQQQTPVIAQNPEDTNFNPYDTGTYDEYTTVKLLDGTTKKATFDEAVYKWYDMAGNPVENVVSYFDQTVDEKDFPEKFVPFGDYVTEQMGEYITDKDLGEMAGYGKNKRIARANELPFQSRSSVGSFSPMGSGMGSYTGYEMPI